jgi:hypothetical protein
VLKGWVKQAQRGVPPPVDETLATAGSDGHPADANHSRVR